MKDKKKDSKKVLIISLVAIVTIPMLFLLGYFGSIFIQPFIESNYSKDTGIRQDKKEVSKVEEPLFVGTYEETKDIREQAYETIAEELTELPSYNYSLSQSLKITHGESVTNKMGVDCDTYATLYSLHRNIGSIPLYRNIYFIENGDSYDYYYFSMYDELISDTAVSEDINFVTALILGYDNYNDLIQNGEFNVDEIGDQLLELKPFEYNGRYYYFNIANGTSLTDGAQYDIIYLVSSESEKNIDNVMQTVSPHYSSPQDMKDNPQIMEHISILATQNHSEYSESIRRAEWQVENKPKNKPKNNTNGNATSNEIYDYVQGTFDVYDAANSNLSEDEIFGNAVEKAAERYDKSPDEVKELYDSFRY